VWLHVDEPHIHVHLAAVARGDPQLRADRLHDGRRAQAEARARGEDRRSQARAYCAAMRAWQDEVHREVSAVCGLARVGPRRRRLTRAGWHAEQRALEAVAEGLRRAEAALAQADQRNGAARVAQAEAARLLAEAQRLRALLGRAAEKLAARGGSSGRAREPPRGARGAGRGKGGAPAASLRARCGRTLRNPASPPRTLYGTPGSGCAAGRAWAARRHGRRTEGTRSRSRCGDHQDGMAGPQDRAHPPKVAMNGGSF
jgi:hypothetical protein